MVTIDDFHRNNLDVLPFYHGGSKISPVVFILGDDIDRKVSMHQ